ncbi:condensation domain-containing protein, partial [Gynuella sp.]|uniref:condensation domain-containing protein n=1 Tax=Gynuella sp. TaxID=2969146 RepID=UPI003D11540D
PLNAADKIDRKRLPLPDVENLVTEYRAPEGEVEQTLAEIWQTLLSVERVGRDDHFFELGGHSLLIIQLIEKLRQAGHRLETRNVFDKPILKDLAATLTLVDGHNVLSTPDNTIPDGCERITPDMLPLLSLDQKEIDVICQSVPGGAPAIQDIYPLAPLQKGLWFHYLMQSEGDAYVSPILFKVDRKQGVDDLIDAFQRVVNRHDILRTCLLWEDLPYPVQVVSRHARLPVSYEQISAAEDIESILAERMTGQSLRLELTRAPLMQMEVFEANEQFWVLLKEHHLISDHISVELELEEIGLLLEGREEELNAPIQYRDFVAHTLAQESESHGRTYFSQLLSDVTEPTAPFGLLDVYGDGVQLERGHRHLDITLANRLKTVVRRFDVSPSALFHAVWAWVVGELSQNSDAVFGTVMSGRLQGVQGVDRILGLFINLLPVRLQTHNVSVQDALMHMHQQLIDLLAYEQVSLAEVQQCSGLTGGTPLFSAILNYRYDNTDVQLHTLEARGIHLVSADELTNYPLELTVDATEQGFELEVFADRRVGVDGILTYVQNALLVWVDALEQGGSRQISAMSFLPPEERHTQLSSFSGPARTYPGAPTLHQRFEAIAERLPTHCAVVHNDQQMDYQTLDRRSNQVAQTLLSQGVQRGQLVAIHCPRSIEFLIGILGTL